MSAEEPILENPHVIQEAIGRNPNHAPISHETNTQIHRVASKLVEKVLNTPPELRGDLTVKSSGPNRLGFGSDHVEQRTEISLTDRPDERTQNFDSRSTTTLKVTQSERSGEPTRQQGTRITENHLNRGGAWMDDGGYSTPTASLEGIKHYAKWGSGVANKDQGGAEASARHEAAKAFWKIRAELEKPADESKQKAA